MHVSNYNSNDPNYSEEPSYTREASPYGLRYRIHKLLSRIDIKANSRCIINISIRWRSKKVNIRWWKIYRLLISVLLFNNGPHILGFKFFNGAQTNLVVLVYCKILEQVGKLPYSIILQIVLVHLNLKVQTLNASNRHEIIDALLITEVNGEIIKLFQGNLEYELRHINLISPLR
jgi:hypothetical protein